MSGPRVSPQPERQKAAHADGRKAPFGPAAGGSSKTERKDP
jgi:hypothetical protein